MHSLCLFLYFFLWTKGAGASDPTMPFMEYLDQKHLVCLKWNFDDLKGTITFKLVVNTTGWISFGFSPNGGMAGSDIVVGGVGPDGKYFTDRYAKGNSEPLIDEQQSYTLLDLSENDGQTSMIFQRSIQSCDDQDFHITAQPIKLIYAYGTTDKIEYHGTRRGTKEVNLLNYRYRSPLPSDKYLSATVDNITVPPLETYYHCKYMTFPTFIKKHHIYRIEPVVDNSDIVHHLVLYSCPPSVNQSFENACHLIDTEDFCMGVVAGWAVGGGVFEFPDDAGIPFGGGSSDTYYKLEIHYNNPNHEKGLTDSSGLRLHYTDKLRKYDVGVLLTGVLSYGSMTYNIPPGATQFHTYSTCDTALFSKFLNPMPDLQVFAVLLHTHLAGRKVRVGHFRQEKQIDFLGVNENYNFEMQEIVSLGKTKTIKMDDKIQVECTYNTVNRTGMGHGTSDEMCLAFLFYYPAINVTTCISHPNTYPSEGTNNQYEIVEYETTLQTLPQIQIILTDDVSNNLIV
uniref:Monooxygenase, DBH-like 1, like n=1 Tax=Sphaeramia orbicularis TaxID=375764 RepID=A0A673CC00_9TELE